MFHEEAGDAFADQADDFSVAYVRGNEKNFSGEQCVAQVIEKVRAALVSQIEIQKHDIDIRG